MVEIFNLIDSTSPPIITINETHDDEESIKKFTKHFFNYNVFSINGTNLFGGVLVAVHKSIHTQRIVGFDNIPNLEEQKLWYDQNKDEIKDDWTPFCERLEQHIHNYKPAGTNLLFNDTSVVILEGLIDSKFNKYLGVGDAKDWLLQAMNQFQVCGLRRDDQFEAIPLLLEGDTY
ncbi:unnamed protein product [Adineta steineri]|uniref:Uncharacterized protein n=1 Tax=Adineta steineri TaxID=433720 RepID=A0A813M6N9_9BILA|nr:unnamed protein product [Adineta steineri]